MGLVLLLLWVPSSSAQEPDGTTALADRQGQVTDRYRKLEELLLRLADVEADENPERAALLRRAAKQSRETFVVDKLNAAGTSLRGQQFAKAIDSQVSARESLDKLLTLLLSEDRPQRIRDEKKRIANMIKELKVVERLQRSTRARTENGAEIREVADEQSSIAERSKKVSDELETADQADESGEKKDDADSPAEVEDKPADDKPQDDKPQDDKQAGEESKDGKPSDDSKPSDAKPSDSKPSEQTPAEQKPPGEPSSREQPPSDSKPSDSKPSDSKPSDAKPSESKPSDSQSQPGQAQSQPEQSQPKSPEQEAQAQLDDAIKQMRKAEQELDQAKRDEAVQEQKKAEENLRAAIDRLEKILRQLREEEMQRELARLESRLRKMAQMQGKVLDDTKVLAAVPESQRDRQIDLRSGNLAFEEKKIVLEADRAMLLLREEGSSVAFPEVVAQIRSDMQRVAERLAATKLDPVTIGIQEDILAALEEMIAALQQAQRDLEKKKQQEQQGGQQGGQQGEQPLVEQIAELKLIRTMETRIKSTTSRYAEMLDQQAGGANDVLPLLRDLSQRQTNLYRITRDLVLKRNQ